MKTKLAFSVLALTALCGASLCAPRASAQDADPVLTPMQAAPDTQTKPEDQPPYFPDVPRNHWAYDAVQKLAATGIIVGRPVPPRRASKVADGVTQQMRSASWLGDAAYAKMLRLRFAHAVVASGIGYGYGNCLSIPGENPCSQEDFDALNAQLETATPNHFVRSSLVPEKSGLNLRLTDLKLRQGESNQRRSRVEFLVDRSALLSQITKHLGRRTGLLRTYKPNSAQVKAEDAVIAKLNKQMRNLEVQQRLLQEQQQLRERPDSQHPRYQLLGN